MAYIEENVRSINLPNVNDQKARIDVITIENYFLGSAKTTFYKRLYTPNRF